VSLNYSQKFLSLPLALILIASSSVMVFAEDDLTQEEIDVLVLSIYGPNYQGAGAHINPDQHPTAPVQSVGQPSPEVAAAITPGEGCNCVVFRMDDVQDFFVHDLQIMIFDDFTNRGEKLTIGPIANFFNQTTFADQPLVDAAVTGVSLGQFELFNHGFNHTDFSAMNDVDQLSNMTVAQSKLSALFPAPPNVFVPPFNNWNADTETAMISNAITILSSQVTSEPIPGDILIADGNHNTAGSGLYHLPVSAFFEEPQPSPPFPEATPPIDHTATSILADIDTSIAERGYAVVLLHPFEFSQFTGVWPDKVYNGVLETAQYQDLTDVINGVIAKGYPIKTFNQVVAFSGNISIDNVTQVEGTGGTTDFVFDVTRTGVGAISVQYQTADVSATSPADYTAQTLSTLNFGSNETLKTITVPIVTDSTIELDETFNVNLSNCVDCNIIVPQGVGTIQNDDLPDVSIGNVTLAEGTGGSTNFVFNVNRTSNVGAMSVDYQTEDVSASSFDDYTAQPLTTLSFVNGAILTKTVTVPVVTDSTIELDETFNVNLSNCVGCNIIVPQGVGTITNDDIASTVTINDIAKSEGNSGTTDFIFNVTRSSNVGAASVQFQTSDNTATSPSDFTSLSLSTMNFGHPGPLTQTITVSVVGDVALEPNETFNVDLSNCMGCTISDGQGIGIILDDDTAGSHIQNIGSVGSTDGKFSNPSYVAVDSSDRIIVTDTFNHRIQIFNSAGVYQSQFGSFGGGNGQFYNPTGIAVDSDDRIIVADSFNHRIQIFSSNGDFIQSFGVKSAIPGGFKFPTDVEVDSNDRIIVADSSNNRVQIFNSGGGHLQTIGGFGGGNGQFNIPQGIAVDSTDRILVSDSGNSRVQIFNSGGVYQSQFGSFGIIDGEFRSPSGVAVKSADRILVGDTFNNRVQIFDSSGNHLQSFGVSGAGDGQFNNPTGVSVDSVDRIIVADTLNNRLQIFHGSPPVIDDLDSDGIPDSTDTENIINSSTTITKFHTVGNITIQNGSVLTISNGLSVTITTGNKITIESGSGVLVKSGGFLQINS